MFLEQVLPCRITRYNTIERNIDLALPYKAYMILPCAIQQTPDNTVLIGLLNVLAVSYV